MVTLTWYPFHCFHDIVTRGLSNVVLCLCESHGKKLMRMEQSHLLPCKRYVCILDIEKTVAHVKCRDIFPILNCHTELF